jgi:hypothetical protein
VVTIDDPSDDVLVTLTSDDIPDPALPVGGRPDQ